MGTIRHRGGMRDYPEAAEKVTTYAELQERAGHFADGRLRLLIILGGPGKAKSETVLKALDGKGLYVKGYRTPVVFHCELYAHKDQPVIIDDADIFFNQVQLREAIKHLTETKKYKQMDYGSSTKVLEQEGVPRTFHTESSCCIIRNAWDSADPICQAIESRAEIVHFAPNWIEVYKYLGTWFWDQEIMDYLHTVLAVLKEPDIRIVMKAWDRKKAGRNWREIIRNHREDDGVQLMRNLIASKKTEKEKIDLWQEHTGLSRATWYRHVQQLGEYDISKLRLPRPIKLKLTSPPEEVRPDDGLVPGQEEEE